ncbi:MAG TPA: dockerin type I domain-containing protein [Planctomycetota bacterium]|nr:dockerin type I domain-containing protein [Planctomycetota bacterium]
MRDDDRNPHEPGPDERFSEDGDAALPEALRRELRELARGPRVPPEIDRAILENARAHLGRVRRFRRREAVAPLVAMAAALLLAVGLVWHELGSPGDAELGRSRIARAVEDLDGNGRVDILDAFLLARRLRDGEDAPGAWDLTGDGAVDADDVRHLALVAVR